MNTVYNCIKTEEFLVAPRLNSIFSEIRTSPNMVTLSTG